MYITGFRQIVNDYRKAEEIKKVFLQSLKRKLLN